MFPHSCGDDLANAVRLGADTKTVVPDTFVVVRGGTRQLPAVGQPFSANVGPTLEAAACSVPHGQIRKTTAGEIRRLGGMLEWVAKYSPHGTLNQQHVHVIEGGVSAFSGLMPNPVPKGFRIDRGR
jgi:hypothetical protein